MPRQRKPKGGEPPAEASKPARTGVPIQCYLDRTLNAQLRLYMAEARPAPTLTAVVEASLEAFLRMQGYWPPKAGPVTERTGSGG